MRKRIYVGLLAGFLLKIIFGLIEAFADVIIILSRLLPL